MVHGFYDTVYYIVWSYDGTVDSMVLCYVYFVVWSYDGTMGSMILCII
jgi:hypothetical protein